MIKIEEDKEGSMLLLLWMFYFIFSDSIFFFLKFSTSTLQCCNTARLTSFFGLLLQNLHEKKML
jgi:hypothetical protein